MRALRTVLLLGVAAVGLGGCVVYPDGGLSPGPAYVAPAPVYIPPPPPPVVVAPRPYYWGPRPYYWGRPYYYRRW
ncbi:MAG TPA: hypothetical protein VD970_17445 [Acetobacteraceae bacterium]|nr:hypothetical protein [Acetobacteraceae bacterium]